MRIHSPCSIITMVSGTSLFLFFSRVSSSFFHFFIFFFFVFVFLLSFWLFLLCFSFVSCIWAVGAMPSGTSGRSVFSSSARTIGGDPLGLTGLLSFWPRFYLVSSSCLDAKRYKEENHEEERIDGKRRGEAKVSSSIFAFSLAPCL